MLPAVAWWPFLAFATSRALGRGVRRGLGGLGCLHRARLALGAALNVRVALTAFGAARAPRGGSCGAWRGLAAAFALNIGLASSRTLAISFGALAVAVAPATARVARRGFLGWRGGGRWRCGLLQRGLLCVISGEDLAQPAEEASAACGGWGLQQGLCRRRRRCGGSGGSHRCRSFGRDAAHQGFLARAFVLFAAQDGGFLLEFLGHAVAGRQIVQARVVVLEALELVVRRFQLLVRRQQHRHALAQFDLGDLGALLVEQEGGDFHGHLHMHGGGAFLHRLLLDDAQDLQRAGFGVADVPGAVAARAGHVGAFRQRRAQALARDFQQAELGDLAGLHPRTVLPQAVAQAVFDGALVLRLVHVDEVHDDQAAQIAQTHLARDFLRRLEVGAQRGVLDGAAARGTRRVDVDRHQRLGVVDHDGAARRQVHRARIRRLDLVFDLEARKQRQIVAVTFDPADVVGHHMRHELMRLLVHVLRVDQDFTDVAGEVVADGADDERRFLVDQESTGLRAACILDGGPQLDQVVQIPLQFLGAASDAGGAGDQAHAVRMLQLLHGLAQLLSVLALDAA